MEEGHVCFAATIGSKLHNLQHGLPQNRRNLWYGVDAPDLRLDLIDLAGEHWSRLDLESLYPFESCSALQLI